MPTPDSSPSGPSTPPLHDVLIIGAGPCGLAVAARLCEHTPSALFTDDEHQRYHWLNKHKNRVSLKNDKTGKTRLAQPKYSSYSTRPASSSTGSSTLPTHPAHRYSVLCLDASGSQWMSNWNRLFATFDIKHLRSPMFFHVDPADRDSLLAHTHERHKEGELREIVNCVGKEISKHKRKKLVERQGKGARANLEIDERDRKDYFTPSTGLFETHCQCVVDRYGLREGLVRQESVVDIDFGEVPGMSSSSYIFTVRSDKGVHFARTVVLAVGAGCKPRVPKQMHLCMSQAMGHITGEQLTGACHSMQIRHFPDPSVRAKIRAGRETTVLVIGGGLTSAQIGDLALRRGVSKVWHIMRSDFKVKPFDIDLSWMGKFRNHEKATFWSGDSDGDRLQTIQDARNGGSINPPYAKILRQHVTRGKIHLHTNTLAFPETFDEKKHAWHIRTEPPIDGIEDVEFDYIYFATGVQADFEKIPALKTMLEKYPLHGHGGMPCLGEDLEWWGEDASGNSVQKNGEQKDWKKSNHGGEADRHVPLFVTGRLAGLRLGPAAGNLEGARLGAERVALGIEEYLSQQDGGDDAGEDAEDSDLYRYKAGIGSRFDSLSLNFDDVFEESG